MNQIFNSKNFMVVSFILCAFVFGLVVGLRVGSIYGARNTTEIRNKMLDVKPYDASLAIKDLNYYGISPSGFSVEFNTDTKTTGEIHYENLLCEWTVYPSDMFMCEEVSKVLLDKCLYRVRIETYPEGGTVMFRIIDGVLENNRGSLWFYIDLPRPDGTVLPPPYVPADVRE